MKIFTQVLLILFFQKALSQSAEIWNYTAKALPYSKEVVNNVIMEKVPDKVPYYRKNFLYSTYNIYLYPDSTYVFYYASEKEYLLSAGRYVVVENIVTVFWDSLKTAQIVSDYEKYKVYFKFKPPTAFVMENVSYMLEKNVLIPFQAYLKEERLELIQHSNELENRKEMIDEFNSITYSANGKELLVNYAKNKKYSLPIDSIWGFITTQNRQTKLFRVTPKGFNWYGVPGVQIVQTDYFIIYVVGAGRAYSYFSKDLNSKIYPLSFEKIKMVFSDEPEFVEAVYKEFGTHKALNILDYHLNSYRVVEIFKACQELKKTVLKD